MTTHRKASSSERQDEEVASHQRVVGFYTLSRLFSSSFWTTMVTNRNQIFNWKIFEYYSGDDALRLPSR
jgi:hypothetical protein